MSKLKNSVENNTTQNQVTKIFISVAAGGIVGAAAALLLAPKAGHRLRKDLYHTYEDLSSRGQDFVDDAIKTGRKAAKVVGNYTDDLRDTASNLFSTTEDTSKNTVNLVIGAIGGGILGAAAIYLLASQNNEEKTLTHKFKEAGRSATENLKSIDWLETAKEVVATLNNKVNPHHNGTAVDEEASVKGINVQDLVEWAGVGLQVWQNLKRRR